MSASASASPSASPSASSPGCAPVLAAIATPDEVASALLRDGFAILPDAVPPSLCTSLLSHIERYMAGGWHRVLAQDFHGRNTYRFFDLLNADDEWAEVPLLPRVLPVVEKVLGKDMLLGTLGTVSIGPGEKAQAIHADDGLYNQRRPHPEIYVNVILSLSEFTPENGATHVLPGSHRLDRYPDPAATYPTLRASMPPRSALFVLGSTYHGGGANRTSLTRHGVTLAYCAGWVRPQECFLVSVPQDRAARMPERLQRLLGYGFGGWGKLGHIYTREERGPLARRIRMEWNSDDETGKEYRPRM
ncbi:hypothetical protein DFJ74DRAFT_774675 [Hyaloraphidium curvatum]|nr:hypothetical protein DFJ74DRAFT_774675 [Hyaloraphidium curvatum]